MRATLCNSRNGGIGCERVTIAHGFCRQHYDKLRNGRDPHDVIRAYGHGLEGTELTIRLQPSVLAKLRGCAAAADCSPYILLRNIINDWLALSPPSPLQALKTRTGERMGSITVRTEMRPVLDKAASQLGVSPQGLARQIVYTWLQTRP